MSVSSATSDAVNTAAAEAREEVVSEHGSEEVAPSSVGSASSSGHGSDSTGSSLLNKIDKLKADQAALKAAKARLAKDMKNAMKRKKRLQGRASQLSDIDLVEVLCMRKQQKRGHGATPPVSNEPGA